MIIEWNKPALKTYFDTIVERCSIYVKKEILKEKRPWTKDEVFANYRFCNVFRALDKTFVLLEQLPGDTNTREYWAVRVMLRWTANNDLIAHLLKDKMDLLEQSVTGNLHAVEALIRYIVEDYTYGQGNVLTTGSFIVKRPGGLAGDLYMLKSYYTQTMSMKIEGWRGVNRTVAHACNIFQSKYPYCGSFTAYCIASDMMYKDYPLSKASDLYLHAERGPGGVHGMSVLLGYSDGKVSSKMWRASIPALVGIWGSEGERLVDRVRKHSGLDETTLDPEQYVHWLTLQAFLTNPMALDAEHWLCEFYKYYRGNAKKKY